MASAKQYAEERRIQGTVFTIKLLPSICLTTNEGTLFVTQINTDSPLSDYSKNALIDTPGNSETFIEEGFQDNYLIPGTLIEGAVVSFLPTSRFWRKRQPLEHSIQIVATEFADLEIEPKITRSSLQKEKLTVWSSYSNGSNYLLGWGERKNDITPDGVISLVG